MSAKLAYNTSGRVMAFFGNNDKPWWWEMDTSSRGTQDIGYLDPGQRTAKEALKIIQNGDDFSYVEDMIQRKGHLVDGYKMVVNRVNDKVISIVGDKYHVQQPSHFAETIDKIFSGQFVVDTFGALDEGRLLYATCKVREDNFLDGKGGDMMRMLTFIGSCDYTVPFRVAASSIRVVCWNTFQAHLNSSKSMFSARHTPNMAQNIALIRSKIKYLYKSWEDLDTIMRELSNEKITKEDIGKFACELFDYSKEKSNEATKNKIRDVRRLASNEAKEFGYTRLALLNGATEFVSHPERRRFGNVKIKESQLQQEVRLRSGEYNDITDKALGILTADRQELAEMLN